MSVDYVTPSYNGYAYQELIDWPETLDDGLTAKLRADVGPGSDGGYSGGGLLAPTEFSLEGIVKGADESAAGFRTAWDNFVKVHAPGMPTPFIVNSDRFILAEVKDIRRKQFGRPATWARYTVDFLASDPLWYVNDGTGNPLLTVTNLASGGAVPPAANTSRTANPTAAPVLTAAAGSTALGAGVYKAAATYRDLFGETQISPVGSVTITAGQQIDVASLTLPDGATLINLYLSIAAGSTTLAWVKSLTATGATTLTALPAATGSTVVTTAGSWLSLPILTFPVTTAPLGGLIYVSVGSTTFILQPDGTGSLIVDCTPARERVTLLGVDKTSLFYGEFPELAVGANTVLVGVSGGVVLGTCVCDAADRWLTP